jgi:hypothetical protein
MMEEEYSRSRGSNWNMAQEHVGGEKPAIKKTYVKAIDMKEKQVEDMVVDL